jgi:hypothetical protein
MGFSRDIRGQPDVGAFFWSIGEKSGVNLK